MSDEYNTFHVGIENTMQQFLQQDNLNKLMFYILFNYLVFDTN